MPLGGRQPGSPHAAAGAARILLALGVVVVFALLAAVPLIDRYVLTPERVRTTLVPILEARLGRSITIEDAAISWRGLSLTGVSIAEDADHARVADAVAVHADRAVLLLNPLALRHRQIRVEQLYLEGPAFTVARAAAGSWNLGTFGRKDRTAPAPAETEDARAAEDGGRADGSGWTVRVNRVRIRGGTLNYFDAHHFLPDKPLWAQLDDIDLRLSATEEEGAAYLRMSARLRGSDEPDPAPEDIKLDIPVLIDGPIEPRELNATLAVAAEEVDVDTIIYLLKKDPDRPRTKKEKKPGPASLFSFDLTVDRVHYEGYRFENARGRIDLADLGVVTGSIDAELAGGTANVTAEFDFSGEGISVRGRARGDDVDAGALLQRLRTDYLPTLAGKANVAAELAGHADRLGEAFMSAVPGRRRANGGSLEARAVFDLAELDIDRGYADILYLLGPRDGGTGAQEGAERAPIDFAGFNATATINAKKADFQAIPFTDVAIEESFLEGKNSFAATAHAVRGGDARIKFDVDFDHRELPYAGQVELRRVDVVAALNQYTRLSTGNTAGRIDVDMDLAGSLYGVRGRLIETLLAMSADRTHDSVAHARVNLDLERLDLESLLGRNDDATHDIAPRERAPGGERAEVPDPLGPFNTGDLDVEMDLRVGETALGGYVFQDLGASATLTESTIHVSKLTGEVAGGTFDFQTTIGLDYPGLVYEGTLGVVSADIPALIEPFRLESFGQPVGVASLDARFDGSGTAAAQALEALSAEIDVEILAGRIRDSEMFRQIEKNTGIPGFEDFRVKSSGGKIIIAGGRATTEHLLVGGDEARIVGNGKIEFDGKLQFELELGVGPTSQRRLLAPGIVLPYSVDTDGWTNIPLTLEGRVGDPRIRVPAEAYAGTALRVAPDAAGRLITESVGVAGRSGERVLRGGANAVGAVFGNIGSALGGTAATAGDEQSEQSGTGQDEVKEQEARPDPRELTPAPTDPAR